MLYKFTFIIIIVMCCTFKKSVTCTVHVLQQNFTITTSEVCCLRPA